MNFRTALSLFLAMCALSSLGCTRDAGSLVRDGDILWGREITGLAQGDGPTQALAQAIARAERALDAPIPTIATKPNTPPSGDKHDFMTTGFYFWPNPDTPDGTPWILRDGEPNPTSGMDMKTMRRFADNVRDLVIAFRATGDRRFAVRAASDIRAWFLDPSTRMNPHCRYGKITPGVTDGGFVVAGFSNRFRDLVDALLLLESAGMFTDEETAGLNGWFGDLLAWMLESPEAIAELEMDNNHGTNYDLMVALVSTYLGRDDLAAERVTHYFRTRLPDQFDDRGVQVRELRHADSFYYHIYNLTVVIDLFDIARQLGDRIEPQLMTRAEDTIHKALALLVPHVEGHEPWPHFRGRDFPFKPHSARRLYIRAGHVLGDARWTGIAAGVGTGTTASVFDALHPAGTADP